MHSTQNCAIMFHFMQAEYIQPMVVGHSIGHMVPASHVHILLIGLKTYIFHHLPFYDKALAITIIILLIDTSILNCTHRVDKITITGNC